MEQAPDAVPPPSALPLPGTLGGRRTGGTWSPRVAAGSIVTPEAVMLDFELAGLGSRTLARLIDLATLGVFLSVLAPFVAIFGAFSDVGAIVTSMIGGALIVLGYPALAEWRYGGTIGKRVISLEVLSLDGAPITFGQAAARSIFQLVDIFMTVGLVAVISVLATSRSQRPGDLAAGTIVVRSSDAVAVSLSYRIPRSHLQYASTLDISGVGADQYRIIRAFLYRAPDLRSSVRNDLASRLAAPVQERIGHSRPSSVHPETFLACVAHQYQLRHAHAPR